MERTVEGAESASDRERAESEVSQASEVRDAASEAGGAGGISPLPARQEWRRSLQRRASLLQQRRRLGR